MKKRLYFITPVIGRKNGGLGVSAERIVSHLREEFEVIVFEKSTSIPHGLMASENQSHFFLGSYGDSKTQGQAVTDAIIFSHQRYESSAILCFYSGQLTYPCFIASKLLKIPLILFGRGNDVDLEIFGELGPGLIYAWENSHKVFCVSTEMSEKVKALAKNANCTYIPNSVDTSFFSPQSKTMKKSRPMIGLLGDIKHKKNLDLLLQEMPFDLADLHIIGTLRPEAQKLLHGFLLLHPELTEQIKITAFLQSPSDLKEIYNELDIVCIPSIHEGMPNVLLEAMAMEKIVVVSNVGGNLDVVNHENNGFLFSPWENGHLNNLLKYVIKLPQNIKETISKNARETMLTTFSSKAEKDSYVTEILSLLEK